MTVMSNGDTIEAATVGREGASWISAAVGAPSMPCETIVVIEGTALRLPIAALDRELNENGHFRDLVIEYSHALLVASMRTSACNGLHGLQERCARWMLMTLDRVHSDRFAVAKEFLAQLLGTNRPTVSARLGARTGRNSQHAGPEGDPRGSKSAEGSGLRVLRHHSNDLRSSR